MRAFPRNSMPKSFPNISDGPKPVILKVPGTGLEPAHLSIPEPKSGASTNSAIPARGRDLTASRAVGKPAMQGGVNRSQKVAAVLDSMRFRARGNSHQDERGG